MKLSFNTNQTFDSASLSDQEGPKDQDDALCYLSQLPGLCIEKLFLMTGHLGSQGAA
jgi:hypothetical protein